jgi:hypothetical protein
MAAKDIADAFQNPHPDVTLARVFEYMKMLLSRFPEEIIQKYNLNALAVEGRVYIETRKGMYCLKQAGLLANQLLQTCLVYTKLGLSLSRWLSTIS